MQVLVDDPEKLEAIRKREVDITKERIEKILKSGANVILSTQVDILLLLAARLKLKDLIGYR